MNAADPTKLLGEQKRIYGLPLSETVLVKGGAGCGKTTVAVARARQYIHDFADFFTGNPRVLFVTYTNSLVAYVKGMAEGMAPHTTFNIRTLHSIAGSLITQTDKRQRLDAWTRDALISQLQEKPQQYEARFLGEEFSWIKGMMITDEAAYLAKERRGRGNTPRVTQADRPLIWKAFTAYQREMARRNLKDWDDILVAALAIVSTPGFVPLYTHVVIDEAQDFSLLALTLIARLIAGRSVTLVADSAQQIYQSGFSWKETGFQVKSNCSIALLRNYRNTRQISLATSPLRRRILSLEMETESPEELPPADGVKPVLHNSTDRGRLLQTLHETLADPENKRVVIAEPHRRLVVQTSDYLTANGIPINTLGSRASESTAKGAQSVFVDTFHAMKGIEFDAVLLNNLTESELRGNIEAHGDEIVGRNRKVLYVAMTRARRTLHLFAGERPSEILSDLDPDTFETAPPEKS